MNNSKTRSKDRCHIRPTETKRDFQLIDLVFYTDKHKYMNVKASSTAWRSNGVTGTYGRRVNK